MEDIRGADSSVTQDPSTPQIIAFAMICSGRDDRVGWGGCPSAAEAGPLVGFYRRAEAATPKSLPGGPPVIFQEVVHSIETGEAGCAEAITSEERSNGHPPECPTYSA